MALNRPTVLAARSAGLGDLCTAVPALRALRRAFPGHVLVVGTPARYRTIALGAGADAVAHLEDLDPIPPDFHGADVAVNLHGSGPESIERLVAARPARLITYAHPAVPASWTGPAWLHEIHEVDRWCHLLHHAGIAADRGDLRIETPERCRDAVGAGSVVVHPGAAAAGRRWPADRFGAVVRELTSADIPVTITGSADERRLCAAVADSVAPDRVPLVRDLAGRTDVDALLSVVAAARAVLTNDTGVAHLAVVSGTPSVALHGPTSPRRWGPPIGSRRHRAIWRGGTGDPHADRLDPGLARISVGEVLATLHDVMGGCPA